ncbi:hypothetical protein KUCAC02_037735, partial [Chaenocephalus aceratus]
RWTCSSTSRSSRTGRQWELSTLHSCKGACLSISSSESSTSKHMTDQTREEL